MVLQLSEDILAESHGTDEVESHESAEYAQEDIAWHALYYPRTIKHECEQLVVAYEDIGETGCCYGCDENWGDARHSEVDHQYLNGEDESGYWSLEDSGNSSRSTTTHEQHQRLVVESEELTEVTRYTRTRKHDRSLGTYGTTESDCYGRGKDRRPAVMPLQSALLGTYGIEDSGDTVRDVISHHIFYEE